MSVANFYNDWIVLHRGEFIIKRGGMNIGTADPAKATGFADRDNARDARPGHDPAMGGTGQRGATVRRGDAIVAYQRWLHRDRR